MRILLALAIAGFAMSAAAEPPARLTHVQDMNEKGEMNGDATIGQVVVGYYIELQTKHSSSLGTMSDDFTCKSGPSTIMKASASKHARALPTDARKKLATNDPVALENLAIDVVGELEGVDAGMIRADEALGPGNFRPAITAIAYTIGRCRFYR